MSQHSVDLMPDSIRVRALAGLRLGQFIVGAAAALAASALVATHSSIKLQGSRHALSAAAARAKDVLKVEAERTRLTDAVGGAEAFIHQYERIALPLEISAVIATVCNQLPESVTVDQLDIDCGNRPISRSPRSKGNEPKDDLPPRVLTGELSGFASSDEHIAELVSRLESLPPFREVSLDFSRTRQVRPDQLAREFRLSFRINLDTSYIVAYEPEVAAAAESRTESAAVLGERRP